MTKRMKLNNSNGKFAKALSVAALAGLSFFGVNANAEQTVIENQHAESQTDDVYGGAINNPSGETIDSLDVILRDNSAVTTANGKTAGGGAIYNAGTINSGTIGDITGNYAQLNANSYGGAFYNVSSSSNLDGITGDIKDNHVKATYNGYGGAIYNNAGGNLGIISGAVENNYVESTYAYGGAIYNGRTYSGGYTYSTIEELNITSLKNNYTKSTTGGNYADGGALFNEGVVNGGTIGEISGNYAEGSYVHGGAIYNNSVNFAIDAITGDIKNNHAISGGAPVYGGAIYNVGGNFGVITGAIENNYA